MARWSRKSDQTWMIMAVRLNSTKSCFNNAASIVGKFEVTKDNRTSFEILPVEIKRSFGGEPLSR